MLHFLLFSASFVTVFANTSKYVEVEDDSFSVECSLISINILPANVKIMWMLNGLPILEGNNKNARIQVTQMNKSKNETVGTLTFKYLRVKDKGK